MTTQRSRSHNKFPSLWLTLSCVRLVSVTLTWIRWAWEKTSNRPLKEERNERQRKDGLIYGLWCSLSVQTLRTHRVDKVRSNWPDGHFIWAWSFICAAAALTCDAGCPASSGKFDVWWHKDDRSVDADSETCLQTSSLKYTLNLWKIFCSHIFKQTSVLL